MEPRTLLEKLLDSPRGTLERLTMSVLTRRSAARSPSALLLPLQYPPWGDREQLSRSGMLLPPFGTMQRRVTGWVAGGHALHAGAMPGATGTSTGVLLRLVGVVCEERAGGARVCWARAHERVDLGRCVRCASNCVPERCGSCLSII